jgi:predicted nucleic acid-binding protein
VKLILDTNVYLGAFRSDAHRERFRSTFFPLLPVTYLSAVVAYELSVNAAGRRTRDLIRDLLRPMERSGRVVSPLFADWTESAEVVTAIEQKSPSQRSKLPALQNDVLIAISARRIGATVVTYNRDDFRLIRRHRLFALRLLEE